MSAQEAVAAVEAADHIQKLKYALSRVDRRVLASLAVFVARDPDVVDDPRDREKLESLVLDLLMQHPDNGAVENVSDDVMLAAMEKGAGSTVPPEYLSLARWETGIGSDQHIDPLDTPADFSVVVIGGGLSGIAAAAMLERVGVENFVVLDKNDAPGGVWHTNTYPGARVDTPSLLYSYSFQPTPDEGWPDYFSGLPAVRSYLRAIADRYDDKFVGRSCVTRLTWSDSDHRWDVEYTDGNGAEQVVRANVVISAFAMFHHPNMPKVEGLENFRGDIFHSSEWPEDYDYAGKRVVLVGGGASANQILPSVSETAAEVVVIQRTPHWITTHRLRGRELNDVDSWFLHEVPVYGALMRWQQFWEWGDYLLDDLKIDPEWPTPDRSANAFTERMRGHLEDYIHSKLADRPDLIEKVTPDYSPFSKRMIIDNGWYDALKRPNVSLLTSRIGHVNANSVVVDGQEIAADTLVFATGFVADQVMWPIEIRGSGGIDIRERLNENPEGYRGYSLADCPNLFLMWGPNSVAGHGGAGTMTAEMHIRYIVECLRHMFDQGWSWMQVRPEACEAWNRELDDELAPMIYNSGVSNWFKGSRSRVVSLRPHRIIDIWDEAHNPPVRDYFGG